MPKHSTLWCPNGYDIFNFTKLHRYNNFCAMLARTLQFHPQMHIHKRNIDTAEICNRSHNGWMVCLFIPHYWKLYHESHFFRSPFVACLFIYSIHFRVWYWVIKNTTKQTQAKNVNEKKHIVSAAAMRKVYLVRERVKTHSKKVKIGVSTKNSQMLFGCRWIRWICLCERA